LHYCSRDGEGEKKEEEEKGKEMEERRKAGVKRRGEKEGMGKDYIKVEK
jgi:hypothetical protein